MAVYNELQVGRYVRFIQKFFGIKGRQPAPLQYTGEVGSILSLFHGVENRYLEGWNRYTAAYNVAALAGQAGAARLRNPKGSGVIAVLEKVSYFPVVAVDSANVRLGPLTADLTVGTGNPLDPRGPGASSLIVSQSSTGVTFVNLIGFLASPNGRTPADFIFFEEQEVPILPGQAFQVDNTSVNVQFIVTLMWRERAMEESELT